MGKDDRGEGLAGLVAKWRERANKCPWCRLNWDLGAHGCHFEPVPPGEQADEYGGVSENCKAFTLRTCIRELETEIAALEAAAPAGTAHVTTRILKDAVIYGREKGRPFSEEWFETVVRAINALATPSPFDAELNPEQEEPWCELCGHTGWLRDSDGNRTERCVCAATQEQPAGSGAKHGGSETAWLLERDNGKGAEWLGIKLTGSYAEWIWTTDSLQALRLSRREDADALSGIVEEADKVTEHIWS